MKNLILVAAMLMLTITAVAQTPQARPVNSTDVEALLKKQPKMVILDVRTPDEFKAGHVKDAININIHDTDAYDRLGKLDKKATYLVYCRTKNRSGIAVNYMLQNGFTNVYQMMDGMTGWMQNGLTTVQ
jgi:rhodanese-related sulfurtransferase